MKKFKLLSGLLGIIVGSALFTVGKMVFMNNVTANFLLSPLIFIVSWCLIVYIFDRLVKRPSYRNLFMDYNVLKICALFCMTIGAISFIGCSISYFLQPISSENQYCQVISWPL